MKRILSALSVLTCVAMIGAQSSGNTKKPDEQWDDVVKLATPVQAASPARKTPAQVAADRAQKATAARQTSQAAKIFYTDNPTHINAGEAKKVEATHTLLGVVEGDPSYEQHARQIAKSYRENPVIPPGDRFEVALLAERTDARARLGGTASGKNAAELEKIADKLRLEFGSIPQVYNHYVSIARGADMTTALNLANKVLQWPANPEATAEAQSIVARSGLLGRSLSVQLTQLDGRALDLALLSGKLTLVYFLSALSEGYGSLATFKKTLPKDTQVIYYFPIGALQEVTALTAKAPVPGIFCYEPGGTIGAAAQQLGVRHLPYVFGLNRAGKLAAFGPADELAAVIAAANK